MRSGADNSLCAGIQFLYQRVGSLQLLLNIRAQMTNASSCIIANISKPATYGRYVESIKQGCLPNTAAVMACICRFTPVSSSTTGLRAASASSVLFYKADFSVFQSACSLLKLSFSFSIAAKALVSSSFSLEVSVCWDLIFSCRSAV